MLINIDKNTLLAGINTVIKAMSVRTTMNILEGIYLESHPDGLLLRCSDLSLQIETKLPAEIQEDGVAVLPGRLFSEFIRKLPEGDVQLKEEKQVVSISCGRSKTSIQGMKSEEFPQMSSIGELKNVTVKTQDIKNMIRQSVFATAQDETRPILTGALLEVSDGEIKMVALDGFRLAIRNEKIEGNTKARVVIPGKSLLEILRTLGEEEENITIGFSKTHVKLDMGHTCIISRLLEGEFIKYDQILPDGKKTRVRANRIELLESIDRASLMARESKNNIVKFSMKESLMEITANSEMGTVNEELQIALTGNDLDIAFNARYFTDVLKNLEEEELFLDFDNNISPCVVRPIQGDRYIYLILPVRLLMN